MECRWRGFFGDNFKCFLYIKTKTHKKKKWFYFICVMFEYIYCIS